MKGNNRIKGIWLLGWLVLATACEKQESRPALTVPATYNGTQFRSNAAQELALISNLEKLVLLARQGRTGKEVGVRDLTLAFTISSPALKNYATEYYINLLQGGDNYLRRLADASGKVYTPGVPNGGTGGVYGRYLFDANGVEPEQIIGKGLLGAALYNYGLRLYTQNPNLNNPATADQLLALYGAGPTFTNSSNAVKHQAPDRAVAAYAAERDKNDGNGLYNQLKNHFLTLQAAYEAGADYQTERNKAFADILNTWERVHAATVIYNSLRIQSLLSVPNPDENTRAEALHLYNENIGLLNGFRTVPNLRLQENQLNELLTLLNFPPTGSPTPYRLLTSTATELPKLTQVVTRLKSIYGFTDQQMEDFGKNWVAEQNR
ncbi:hypothetical protein [Telluribacter sp.]|jgi:hypothetical protein|uniref:hypothetical protein n=1 Tax=Telluribacter sp. TaxID=1978767 RepID=UPI002E1638CD|nr:hypothetical protein [Telluribacter sp.]